MKRRNTYQRQIILNILKMTDTHPTAEWIYERAKSYIPNLSLGTVYRNLKVLKEEGKILEITDGKLTRFDGRTDNHYHFKCVKCGNIYDVEYNDIEIKESLKKKGFKPLSYQLVITGICKNCKKEK
ncbi:MAG: transcriptional repressor [Persephonella sp.]|nr:MAG: transcriptional repressor [Persephonella sp.]